MLAVGRERVEKLLYISLIIQFSREEGREQGWRKWQKEELWLPLAVSHSHGCTGFILKVLCGI